MGPGPSDVHPRVLQAMATPLVGHLDPAFLEVMDRIQQMLRHLFQTSNSLTLPVSATGSAGMETCIVNLIEPGDVFLACVNGVFGARMADVARRAGAEVQILEKPWGQAFELAEVEEALKKYQPDVVGLVHAETSTGILQPVDGIGAAIKKANALFVLDCVTSLGGVEVKLDEWQVDAAYAGTQKCLSCPPGLAPVSFSKAAESKMSERKSQVQSWYLDLNMVRSYWGGERAYHHTAPISMNYALYEALRLVCAEGIEQRARRHLHHHLALKKGVEAMGLKYAADEKHLLPPLNAIAIPDGGDDGQVRKNLLADYGIEIGGGLGAHKGKVWRIGLMGESCTRENVILVLTALRENLLAQGVGLASPDGAQIAGAYLDGLKA